MFGPGFRFISPQGRAAAMSSDAGPGLPDQQGILFEIDNLEYLSFPSTLNLTAPWSVKMGIQGLSSDTIDLGLFGLTAGSNFRMIAYPGSDFMRMNISLLPLKTSGTFSQSIDFVSRNIIEIYCEAGGDVYYVPSEGGTPQFLFNIDNTGVPEFQLNAILRAGGAGAKVAEGYLYYLEIDNAGTVEAWDFSEGSGATITGDQGTVLTIETNQDLNHINNNMWTPVIPLPAGYAEFTSLSQGGRSSSALLAVLESDPSTYSVGSIDYQIASIYDPGNHNPDGYTHAVVEMMTNDVANVSAFATPDEYEADLTTIVQRLKTAGVTPVLATAGTIVTSIKQAEKDYDSTIGSMLSGDPANPTPEAEWDFNEASTGITAVTPLYVAKVAAVAAAESISYYDALADFIAGQTAPYDQWVTLDGVHYNSTGYLNYGQGLAAVLSGLSGVSKVAVLGDSLGASITENTQAAFN